MARIDFLWPEVAVLYEEIFTQEIRKGEFPVCCSMIEALKKVLERNRKCIDERPNCSVDLKISGIVAKDRTRFLIVPLMTYQTAYTVKKTGKIVVFKDI